MVFAANIFFSYLDIVDRMSTHQVKWEGLSDSDNAVSTLYLTTLSLLDLISLISGLGGGNLFRANSWQKLWTWEIIMLFSNNLKWVFFLHYIYIFI